MNRETFPGVYTTISDESTQRPLASRFRAGLVGIASKGPMDAPTAVPSLKSFTRLFGTPVADYEMTALAVSAVSEFSDGTVFTRVGKKYEAMNAGSKDGSSTTPTGGSGQSVPDAYKVYTASAKDFSIGDYIRVVQAGQKTTVNARIEDYIPTGDTVSPIGLALVSTGADAVPLASLSYTEAYVDRSALPNAASNAEALLHALTYGTSNYAESAGFIRGDKSKFEFTTDGIVGPQAVTSMSVTSGVAEIAVGTLAAKFKVGDRIHIANTKPSSDNGATADGEYAISAVDTENGTLSFTILAEYGPELLTGVHVTSGYAEVAVTPGAIYTWVKGVAETMLVNGSQRLDDSTAVITAQGSFIRVYVNGNPATGSLKLLQGLPDGTVEVAAGTPSITLAVLAPGDIIKISQTGRSTTVEAMVKEIVGGTTVRLHPSSVTEYGYQPVSLQDNYTAGLLAKATRDASGQLVTAVCQHLVAASAGTWANSATGTDGLMVKVAPGSGAGTKKFLVYERGSLVETIDNLSLDSTSDDYYVTRINGVSSYIAILEDAEGTAAGMILTTEHPANTMGGWGTTSQTINRALFGADGYGQGFNGELAEVEDYIGSYDSDTDRYTGMRAFIEEGSNLNLTLIAAPGVTSYAVHQELLTIAERIHAEAVIDHPKGLNGRQIVNWSNGAGEYYDRGQLDSWHGAILWNWFTMLNPFDGSIIWAAPSIGLLRQVAMTSVTFKPWFAAAGETRGVLSPFALNVEFPHVSQETRSAMYGGGQVINPILKEYGKILIYGNRTLQRTDSKLTDLAVALLVKYVVKNMAIIGRKYIFDPNDQELLAALFTDYTNFLESIKADRGLQSYSLKIDSENNTPEIRNQQAAIVDVGLTPYGTMERLYINATVNQSTVVVNSVQ